MKVSDLIAILQTHQEKYGPDAQVAVPRAGKDLLVSGVGREIRIVDYHIATVLESFGEDAKW